MGIGIYLFYRSHVNSHYSRLIAFGIFWFFITLSVESSVIPIVDVIFEHRVYLPSVGFFLAFVVGFAILVERINSKVVVRVVVAGVITAGVLLGGMTYGRNRVWQNAITLWEDVLKKSPNNARAHNNLGNAYVANNMFDNAIEHFEKSYQLSNDYGQLSNYNLGVIYHNKGLIDLAISKYQKALKLETAAGTSPHIYSYIHNNLGLAYQSKNLHYKAIQHFQSSISLKPDEPNAHSDIGVSYLSIGLRDDAIRHFKTALRLSPGHKEAQSNLRRANFK